MGVEDVEAELGTVREHCAIDAVLPEIRRLLEVETVLVLTPAESLVGLDVARFHIDGAADPAGLHEAFVDVCRRQPRRYAWYDPICPEPEQRNRLIEAHDVMPPGELEQSYIYHRLLVPFGLGQHRQPRVLLCDGSSLLAWFGCFHPQRIDSAQWRLLGRLARSMHARLLLERRLTSRPDFALHAALEHVGGAAFVIAGDARIVDMNACGRALLESRRDDVVAALAGAPLQDLEVEQVPMRLSGMPDLRLVLVRAISRAGRIASTVARAASRWQLTPKQCDVLTRVVAGDANTTIAADLHVSSRAVEMHLTELFSRTQTGNRAELVATVLLA